MAQYRIERNKIRDSRNEWSVRQYFPSKTAGVVEWMCIGGVKVGSTENDVLEKFNDPTGSVCFCATILRDFGVIKGRSKGFDWHMVGYDCAEQIKKECVYLNTFSEEKNNESL